MKNNSWIFKKTVVICFQNCIFDLIITAWNELFFCHITRLNIRAIVYLCSLVRRLMFDNFGRKANIIGRRC